MRKKFRQKGMIMVSSMVLLGSILLFSPSKQVFASENSTTEIEEVEEQKKEENSSLDCNKDGEKNVLEKSVDNNTSTNEVSEEDTQEQKKQEPLNEEPEQSSQENLEESIETEGGLLEEYQVDKVPLVNATYSSERIVLLSWSEGILADRYNIYYSTSRNGKYTLLDTVSGDTYSYTHDKDKNAKLKYGQRYYYKVLAQVNYDGQDYFSTEADIVSAKPEMSNTSITVVSQGYHTVKITLSKVSGVTGYIIYRSDSQTGGYSRIATVTSTSYTDYSCTQNKTYYYKAKPYLMESQGIVYGKLSGAKAGKAVLAAPTILSTSNSGNSSVKICWTAVADASGYVVYRSTSENGTYTRLKVISGGTQTSCVLSGQTNGNCYYYKMGAYRTSGSTNLYSYKSQAFMHEFDIYGYEGESYESRCQRIFGTNYYKDYTSSTEAKAHMVPFSIKVWDFASDGKTKITKVRYLTTNAGIASTVKQIFNEIYTCGEKIPINAIGCYSWRGDNSSSEHCEGLAIDVNPNENYMISNGKILSGSFFKPGVNPYSIPEDSKFVKIMNKYGFMRGEWPYSNRYDYMHFSYFGT